MSTSSPHINRHFRQKCLFYVSVLLIGMLLLAGSLSTLRFEPGMPVPGVEPSVEPGNPVDESNKSITDFHPMIQLPVAIIFFLILILMLSGLFKKIKFAKTIRLSSGLILVLCLFLLLNQINFQSPALSLEDSQGIDIKTGISFDSAPIGNPPIEIIWLVIIALVIGAFFVITWLIHKAPHQPPKEELIANEAGAALEAIESGCDLRNVIIRCYMQMLLIAQAEQGLERTNSMTPREFERIVTAKGIPQTPIHQLTTLFEKVRYGSKPTSKSDETKAIECLSAIQLSCRSEDREFNREFR